MTSSDRPESGPVDLKAAAEIIALVTAPTAAVAALGVYFGWRRTQTYAAYFGIDTSTLGFSVQDYVLRSSTSVYRIVFGGIALALAGVGLHRIARYRLDWRGRTAVARMLAAVAAFLLLVYAGGPVGAGLGLTPTGPVIVGISATVVAGAAGLVVLRRRSRRNSSAAWAGWVMPPAWTLLAVAGLLMADALAAVTLRAVLQCPYLARDTVLAVAVALVVYAVHLARSARMSATSPAPPWIGTLSAVLAMLLVAAGLFAAVDEYADQVGTSEATLTVARLEGRRGLIVFTRDRFDFGPGTTCRPVPGQYPVRCDGLRFFVQTPSGILAIPSTWSRDDGLGPADRVILIPLNDDVRLEFTPGESDFPDEGR